MQLISHKTEVFTSSPLLLSEALPQFVILHHSVHHFPAKKGKNNANVTSCLAVFNQVKMAP